jgi:hypothetical protein
MGYWLGPQELSRPTAYYYKQPHWYLLPRRRREIKNNVITKSNVGIDFNCLSETVTGNTIDGAATGINTVPAAFTGVNKFYDVATIRTNGSGC